MKPSLFAQLLGLPAALAALVIIAPSAVFAQGSLLPPGPPGATMKTLDQIEARKPLGTSGQVTTSTLIISEPGSYVLVGPITVTGGNGITINTNNVTLDLNGFTISSTAPTDDASAAVKINGVDGKVFNVTVRNGLIYGPYTVANDGTGSGAGFTNGIFCLLDYASNISVSQVSIRGVRDYGIYLGDFNFGRAGAITDSSCSHSGSGGLRAETVARSLVRFVGSADFDGGPGYGISASTIVDCNLYAPGTSYGMQSNTVINSIAHAREFGIRGSSVTNCTGRADGATGIGIDATTVINSVGQGTIVGIHANSAVTNSSGFSSDGSGSRIGINCPDGTVSFSRGRAPTGSTNRAIIAKIAVACTATGDAPIQSPSLQLGTVGVAP